MFEVAVAQYGHEMLKGDRHWALLVVHEPASDTAYAYQLTGSTTTYELKPRELVVVTRASSYLGRVRVGTLHPSQLPSFELVARTVPVHRGSREWHCQHWVADALLALNNAGITVQPFLRQQLAERLSTISPA
ncbi:hypothetical protein BKA62DRAFT_766433 [Auriculariales sp. MPI-PUGE-AT-0066]|nr:hypothetical protein BKA62DRAFT_766433 [Auriculariales sp. MPI-PUGE-AT-0066]